MKKIAFSTNDIALQPRLTDTRVEQGLILIPDISGFTRFVHTTSLLEGQSIASELLLSILEHNILDLKASEIEGDAILFYKPGPLPSLEEIIAQYEYMLQGFYQKLEECHAQYNKPLDLSLKVIAHYGEIAEYTIRGFKKLYGEAIIEAHRLLKNSIPSHSYVLITDDLMKAAPGTNDIFYPKGTKASKLCEVYGDLRNICFTYFDYEPISKAKLIA